MQCCGLCTFPSGVGDFNPQEVYKKMAGEQFADFEEVVRHWADEQFEKRKKLKKYGKVKRENLRFTVNWDRVNIEYAEPVYLDMVSQQCQASNVLFRSTFLNSTNSDQAYSFKTERASRSCATVVIEKGYTIGQEFSLELKLPEEIVQANAGFKREVSLKASREQTIEEELVWGADSQVKVSARSEASVQLEVAEEKKHVRFKHVSRLRGNVLVTVTNLKDNNSIVTVYEGGIAEIIQRDSGYTTGEMPGVTVEGKTVTVETTGSCGFVFGVGQQVQIAERKLDKDAVSIY